MVGGARPARSLLAVRVPLLVLTTFALGLLVHQQVPDVIRRWRDTRLVGLAGITGTLLLAVGLWYTGHWMLSPADAGHDHQPRHRDADRIVAWVLAGLAALIAIGVGLPNWSPNPGKLIPLVVMFGVVVLLGLPFRKLDPRRRNLDVPGWGQTALPRLLASATVAVLGLAVLRASAGLALYGHLRGSGTREPATLVLIAALLLVFAGMLYLLGPPPSWLHMPKGRTPPAAALLVCVAAWWVLVWWLSSSEQFEILAPWLGTVGLLSIGLLLVAVTGCATIAFADRVVSRPLPLFRALWLRRVPLLWLVLAWLLLITFVSPSPDRLYDVIPQDQRPPATSVRLGATLEQAFDRWRTQNCLLPRRTAAAVQPAATPKPVVPLILVASAGGGVRAAAWTAYVLDRALGYGQGSCTATGGRPDPAASPRADWVFAMSGVSGGSLGLAAFAAHLAEPDAWPDSELADATSSPSTPWVRQRLGADNLAASLGWLLLVEAPWSLLRFRADKDRARVLEATWERAWTAGGGDEQGLRRGLFELDDQSTPAAPGPHIPLLIFNGTSVESGCRFNASVLKANGRDPGDPSARCLSSANPGDTATGALGATVDLVDLLCAGEDIPLSKAALLSARFPVISPSGHLQRCPTAPRDPETTAATPASHAPETYVVDGGYLENSGAATALDLWGALAPLVDAHNRDPASPAQIVPFFLQINNGYGQPAGPGAVPAKPQAAVPFLTIQATAGGRQAMARQSAQLIFGRQFVGQGLDGAVDAGGDLLCTRYTQFSLRAHPGAQAPLGWTLSTGSFDDLVRQFREANVDEHRGPAARTPLEQVDGWFHLTRSTRVGPTACAPTP